MGNLRFSKHTHTPTTIHVHIRQGVEMFLCTPLESENILTWFWESVCPASACVWMWVCTPMCMHVLWHHGFPTSTEK
eukprot:NODE_2452_length_426_cov_76.604775_g2371_i0.p2 GENE.NODE_2452_length_426_cov_76.604775_g2371_i0~~NODE_2452_length_426_cov_76.604775_g2371_i0.p2  ORF type:complete len:87 (+),score=23.27 NODE_2452_length_426_cov_76.604775_g2371_i0:31-261(+)